MKAKTKATIAVMDAESHFNITRGATFTDIIFRGDYGLTVDRTNDKTKAMKQFCEIRESDNSLITSHKRLNVTSIDSDE